MKTQFKQFINHFSMGGDEVMSMKKLKGALCFKVLAFAVLAVFATAGNSMALPFSSIGMVNANYENSWDENTLTGTALYSFYLLEDGFDVNYLELNFEDDIFDLSNFDANSITVLNPTDWTDITYIGGTGTWTIASAGTPVNSTNDPLQILVNYTLLSADRFNDGSGGTGSDAWSWYEGDAWSQEYILSNSVTMNGILYSADSSGGSTAPVPEPGTLLLLGSGLVGLAFYGRRRKEEV